MPSSKRWRAGPERKINLAVKLRPGKVVRTARSAMGQYVSLRKKAGGAQRRLRNSLKTVLQRARGAVRSEIKCGRPGCDERISLLAKKLGDAFCSRECAEKFVGGAR